MHFVSCQQAFDRIISLISIPDSVSQHLKNKASTVSAFLSRVRTLNPEIIFPVAVDGFVLRFQMMEFVRQLQNENPIGTHPQLVARIILQTLSILDVNSLTVQFHRGLSIRDDSIHDFDSCCALGMESTQPIDHHANIQTLPGYARITNSPSEIIRMSTSLLNYMSFSSNSQLQQ